MQSDELSNVLNYSLPISIMQVILSISNLHRQKKKEDHQDIWGLIE